MVQQRRELNGGEIRLVDCAGCGEVLLGASLTLRPAHTLPARWRDFPFVAGRVDGRPLCGACINDRRTLLGLRGHPR
jgi:hypothetical protein